MPLEVASSWRQGIADRYQAWACCAPVPCVFSGEQLVGDAVCSGTVLVKSPLRCVWLSSS